MNKIAAGLLGLAVVAPGVWAIELDPSFGLGGQVSTRIAEGGDLRGLAVFRDGRIVVAGNVDNHVLMGVYTSHGQLDPAFGSGGLLSITHGFSDSAVAVALQADGKIVVGGNTSGATTEESGGMVFRLLPSGNVDPSFGAGGFAFAPTLGIVGLAIQADGKIVAAGMRGSTGPATDFAAARFEADGDVDNTFGSGGLAVMNVGDYDFASGMILDEIGRIVLAGSFAISATEARAVLVRLLADGPPDPGFGSGGVVSAIDSFSLYGGVTTSHDGRIVAFGFTQDPNHLVVARHLADGNLDPTFGGGAGLVLSDSSIIARAVAVDDANRVVLVGGNEFVLARYLPDGAPDLTVGPNGWTTVGFHGNHAEATAVEILRDGAILVAGYTRQPVFAGICTFTLLRYGGNSTPIPTLSEIGTFLFGALLGLAGLLAIRRIS